MIKIATRYKFIATVVAVAISLIFFFTCEGSRSDAQTAQAVAALLARAEISDDDISSAMRIRGVHDAYVVSGEGIIELPTQLRGVTANRDSAEVGRASLRLDGDRRVVIVAHKPRDVPRSPIAALLACIAGGFVIVTRRRGHCLSQNSASASQANHYDDDGRDTLELEQAAQVADGALVLLDRGCRIVAASNEAQRMFGVKRVDVHLVDVLKAEAVQPFLQLIRRSDNEGYVRGEVRLNEIPVMATIVKDDQGFIIKLSSGTSDE